MKLEDLLNKEDRQNKDQLVKKWDDSRLLDGLKPGKSNMAQLLAPVDKQYIIDREAEINEQMKEVGFERTKENIFVSPGVFKKNVDVDVWKTESQDVIEYLLQSPDILFGNRKYKGSNLEFEINKLCAQTAEAYQGEPEIDDTEMNKNEEIEIPDYLLNDPEIVGYPDKEMQDEIYKWVAHSIPWNGYTLKDLGAGRGDFYGFLREERDTVKPQYIGLEQKNSLVLAGSKKYPDIDLINSDFLTFYAQTDYTVCIGSLNEDHGFDKWEYFNKTLNYALSNTDKAIIFILASNMEGNEGFLDYPIDELVSRLPKGLRFNIDYTRLEDIYKLTVHIGGYN